MPQRSVAARPTVFTVANNNMPDGEFQIIKRSLAFRAEYRADQSSSSPTLRTVAPFLVVPHPMMRGGAPVTQLRGHSINVGVVHYFHVDGVAAKLSYGRTTAHHRVRHHEEWRNGSQCLRRRRLICLVLRSESHGTLDDLNHGHLCRNNYH